MVRPIVFFEQIVRKSYIFTEARPSPIGGLHPFEERDIHPELVSVSKALFDDGHFAQATFEAYKFIDKEIQKYTAISETGFKLMMQAFAEGNPKIKLNEMKTMSEKNEQKGFRFLFAGSVLAIRNPRGHEVGVSDGPDTCLDHLSLASLLLRRIEDAGLSIPPGQQ